MGKKLTTSEFIEKSIKIHGHKYDYSLVDYVNSSLHVKIIYNNIVYLQIPSSHLSGYSPEKKVLKLNTKLFIERSQEIHGDKYDYSMVVYKNRFEYVKIIYNGVVYLQTPDLHLDGCCPEKKQISKTTEEFIQKSKSIYGDKYDYSLSHYVNKLTKIKIIYNNEIYEQLPRYHFKKAPELSGKSNGELKIKSFLKKHNIEYITEYTFNGCKNKIKLRYDFYLPLYNMLIEYDGIQHFKSISYFGGDNGLKNIIKNDKIKTKYAKNNNIYLLRINYLHFDYIDNIISDYLLNLSKNIS